MHRFFLIFEEFHTTIGLNRKHLKHAVNFLGARQNQGEVRQYRGFLESETFCFFFDAAFFQSTLLLFFEC